MKKILIAIAYSLILSVPLFAQAPTLLQVKNDLDWAPDFFSSSGGFASGQTAVDQLPNAVGQHNTLFELIAVDDTTNYPTIADSLGLTWTRNATCKDTTNGEDVLIYTAPTGSNSGYDHDHHNVPRSESVYEHARPGGVRLRWSNRWLCRMWERQLDDCCYRITHSQRHRGTRCAILLE